MSVVVLRLRLASTRGPASRTLFVADRLNSKLAPSELRIHEEGLRSSGIPSLATEGI